METERIEVAAERTTGAVRSSLAWSFVAECAAKLITPVTNMVLARLLAPEAFGVVAVCNMIVSFADILTDAGFGKYLVQSDFESIEEKNRFADVAFWSNLAISAALLLTVIVARDPIARMLGHEEYAFAISVACVQLLFSSLSSIQTGLLRRGFDFKRLFIARIAVAATPLLIAVPLALIFRSFWALIIGNLAGAMVNAIALTAMSSWKPRWYYSIRRLKKMFGYSFWSLCEGLANWAIFWFDTFLVANAFSDYYLGIYRNSSSMVMSIMGMISASMSPVLLASLSRVKHNAGEFRCLYLAIQRFAMYVAFPMGLGLACYSEVATVILFGEQWIEASDVVRSWALMMMCSVAFYSFPAELYKSSGIPRRLFLSQILYLLILVPVSWYAIRLGFDSFVLIRCFCVLGQMVITLAMLKVTFGFGVGAVVTNLAKPLLASLSIVVSWIVFSQFDVSHVEGALFMVLSGVLYCAIVAIWFRKDILNLMGLIKSTRIR